MTNKINAVLHVIVSTEFSNLFAHANSEEFKKCFVYTYKSISSIDKLNADNKSYETKRLVRNYKYPYHLQQRRN